MKALEAIAALSDLCASQRGMFTSAQALAAGVDRMALSRLTQHGQIEPVARGVYRASAAPVIREEDIYAAWLMLDPATPAYRRAQDATDFVASLNTAAWLMGFGELKPEPLTFSYPKRRQTRKSGMRFLRRSLDQANVVIVGGIPTTGPQLTVLDLIDAGEDLSLVASVMVDAEAAQPHLELKDQVNFRAAARGFGVGFDLYEYMKGR